MPVAEPRGAEGFISYYAELFGARWPGLERALSRPASKVLRLNGFAAEEAQQRQARGLSPLTWLPGCYELGRDDELKLHADADGLLCGYVMDPASVLAARALGVQEGERVLDFCAAPGGKALVLAESLGETGALTVNDRSRRRAARLRSVLRQYLPTALSERVKLTTRDARRWGLFERAAYDAILVDAPCSSERHVFGDRAELRRWSPGRVRRLALDQYALLASAATALKPGGRLLYCTCALAPQENDRVVARLLDKARHALEPRALSAPLGEPTEYGWQVHPDRHGYGPIYFVKLGKLEDTESLRA